jgi:uncharacterized protein (TIGR00369 family)
MSDDEEFPPGVAEVIREAVENQHGYLSWLNTSVDDIDWGRCVLTVPFDDKLTNTQDPPTMHGGIAATLIDTAGGLALRTTLDEFDGGVATVNLNVNYLLPASGDLTATAEVVRSGSTIGVSDILVESPTPDGEQARETVAVGQGAYRLFR